MDYLDDIQEIQSQEPLVDIPEEFILLFNEFVIYYVPEVRKETSLSSFNKQIIVKVMFELGKWLKRMRLTQYTIVMNQTETI